MKLKVLEWEQKSRVHEYMMLKSEYYEHLL